MFNIVALLAHCAFWRNFMNVRGPSVAYVDIGAEKDAVTWLHLGVV